MTSEAKGQDLKEKEEPRTVERKVHVVFDMTTARLLRTGGRVYADELANALCEHSQYRVTCISAKVPPRRLGVGTRIWNEVRHFVWIQAILPLQLLWLRADLVHVSSFNAPMLCPCPVVLTIFDTFYLDDQPRRRKKLAALAAAYSRFYIAASVRRADAICTVSNVSKSDIESVYGIAPGRVHVTYNGVSDRYYPQSETQLAAIREKYCLSRPFFLFVGNFAVRKNLARLIEAFSIFRKDASVDHQLILVGPQPLIDRTGVTERLQEPEIAAHVRSLGFVPDEDLPGIYAACEAFAFPSLAEGFGIPIIEAMACGAPVIVSNSSCMPEVAGDAALYFDPRDPADMARAMKLVLRPDLRQELKRKGLERARLFTWKNAALQTEKAYADALG